MLAAGLLTAACQAGSSPASDVRPATSTPPVTAATGPAASTPDATVTTTPPASPTSVSPTSASPTTIAPALPAIPAVTAAGAEPAVRFPTNDPAVGAGANAVIGPIPDALWARMVGYSWTPGCPVGRSSLRLVQVNFFGFDGYRYRGGLVVNASIASATASVFTRLYDQQFRIRQMRPMDSTWGHNPKGPGADDYAAMSADNTSAFNCRYVGGEEASKVYSLHASGLAIDVNDFENPYVDSNGIVYPDTYWLHHRSGAGVFTSRSSAAVRAFTALGFTWGGTWQQPDLQHFQR